MSSIQDRLDMINRAPGFQPKDLGMLSPLPGQVRSLNRSPFAVVVLTSPTKLGDHLVCDVVPAHNCIEAGSSDDLRCTDDDKPLDGFIIALWARTTVEVSHLGNCIGELSNATRTLMVSYPKVTLEVGTRGGPDLAGPFDFRREFRTWLASEMCSIAFNDAIIYS